MPRFRLLTLIVLVALVVLSPRPPGVEANTPELSGALSVLDLTVETGFINNSLTGFSEGTDSDIGSLSENGWDFSTATGAVHTTITRLYWSSLTRAVTSTASGYF